MAVTMTTAEQALKILYLGVVTEQLNTKTNPLYNAIKSSTQNVVGKEVRKMAPYGVNGGVGAGTEDGALPVDGGNNYIQFVSTTKNLYGTIKISDKSIKASRNNAGAFVQLLNQELDGLMRAAKFNFGRQLFTDGQGVLTTCKENATATDLLQVNSTQYIIEGMTIDIRDANGDLVTGGAQRRVLAVDRLNNRIKISGNKLTTEATDIITVQNSYGRELTGFSEIFKNTGSLYGVDRSVHYWMVPYMQDNVGEISDVKIQKAIDYQEEITGSKVNFICTASGVRRAYQEYLEATKRTVNTLELKGGFTAISYNGIPFVNDRFMPSNTMYLLNTDEFTFHHMGEWEWMEGDGGRILKQVPGYPLWTATLVKYAELICDHPGGQSMLSGILEDGETPEP
jgi:hypothetical protein